MGPLNRPAGRRTALKLIKARGDDFSPWSDGAELPGMITAFRGGRWRLIEDADEVASGLEYALISTVGRADVDDLNRILRSFEQEEIVLPRGLRCLH